jgi:long-chain acyl-CoA synthetase
MLCYTSGTTGDPKGVKFNHKMFVSNTHAATAQFPLASDRFTEKDCYISYLPAAHSFEQWLFFFSICTGAQLGFYGGDPRAMTDKDIPYLKPTFFPSVPRLLNVIYSKLKARFDTEGGLAGYLMRNGIEAKLANIKATGSFSHCFYDKLVFSKVR